MASTSPWASHPAGMGSHGRPTQDAANSASICCASGNLLTVRLKFIHVGVKKMSSLGKLLFPTHKPVSNLKFALPTVPPAFRPPGAKPYQNKATSPNKSRPRSSPRTLSDQAAGEELLQTPTVVPHQSRPQRVARERCFPKRASKADLSTRVCRWHLPDNP